jgi:hypothetical protein
MFNFLVSPVSRSILHVVSRLPVVQDGHGGDDDGDVAVVRESDDESEDEGGVEAAADSALVANDATTTDRDDDKGDAFARLGLCPVVLVVPMRIYGVFAVIRVVRWWFESVGH